MSMTLALLDKSYAWFGMFAAVLIVIGLIVNVASLHTKDMNRLSGHATTLLFIAFIIEAGAWTVRGFGGGTETGVFWAVVSAAFLHVASAVVALFAFREHHTIGRWPHGRRRAVWGVWLNVTALIFLGAWFYLGLDTKAYKLIFE